MTPARFRWGILFVTVGLLLLLRNLSVLNDDFWIDLLVYFPVVLIAIGIEKIFTKSRFQFISYATSVLLLAGGVCIAFYSGSSGVQGSFFSETSHRIELDPDVKTLSAELRLGRTNLTIRDSGDDMVYGRFSRFTRKPKISYRVEDDVAIVTFNSRRNSYLGGAIRIDTGEDQDWYVRFSEELPLNMRCSGHDSDIHLNMSTTPLRSLTLDADEASIYLKLGELEPSVTIIIEGEEASLKLRLPESVGLRVAGDDYQSYLLRMGLVEEDGFFVSEGYDTLDTKVELDLDEGLASFSLDYF